MEEVRVGVICSGVRYCDVIYNMKVSLIKQSHDDKSFWLRTHSGFVGYVSQGFSGDWNKAQQC